MRNGFLLLLSPWLALAAGAATPAAASLENGKILVIADKSVPAYREASENLRRGLNELAGAVVETTPESAGRALESEGSVKFAVAIGSEARAALGRAQAKFPVISAMLSIADLTSETNPPARSAGAVYLDLDFVQVAQEVSRLFPSRKRLGVIVHSRGAAPNKQMLARLAKDGIQVQVVVSPNRNGLPDALRDLKGRVDLVICLPETGLFDSRNIPAFLRQSLEDQLPVVGFSPSFVRAGAIAGVFPDYADIGLQAADLLRRALASPSSEGADETPRKVASVTNPTVMRLLGWKQGQ